MVARFTWANGPYASSHSSSHKDLRYTSKITDKDWRKTPIWDPSKQELPPLSPGRAYEAAHAMFLKTVQADDLSMWKLQDITLKKTEEKKSFKWYYMVSWLSPQYSTDKGTFASQLYFIVLMNGVCIRPEISNKNDVVELNRDPTAWLRKHLEKESKALVDLETELQNAEEKDDPNPIKIKKLKNKILAKRRTCDSLKKHISEGEPSTNDSKP